MCVRLRLASCGLLLGWALLDGCGAVRTDGGAVVSPDDPGQTATDADTAQDLGDGAEAPDDEVIPPGTARPPWLGGSGPLPTLPPPENVSFESARSIEVDDPRGVLQPVPGDEQVDHFSFEGEAGAFYVIQTNRGPFSPDNVVTLLGPDLEPIATNDDGARWIGDPVDARLLARLRQSGTHYLQVEDRVTPSWYFLGDGPLLFYRITVARLDDTTPGIALEGDAPGAAISFLEDVESGFLHATALGTLSPDGPDRFELQGIASRALIARASRDGLHSEGGGAIEILDAQGAVVARIDPDEGQPGLHPPLGDQRYELIVSPGSLDEDDYYAVDLVLLPDNPLEIRERDNDLLEGAEDIAMQGTLRRRGLLLTLLPPGDVDHYRFEAAAGELLTASCESHSAGSGVRGLELALLDPAGTSLADARETAFEAVVVQDVPAQTSGYHALRLSADDHHAEIAGHWVRCMVLVDQP